METPNPYESPQELDAAKKDERFVRRYAPLLYGGLAGGMLLSAFYPFIGVPLSLVAWPAMVRATRIYWRTVRASHQLDWTDWCGFFFASLAVVLPLSFVGGIAFCCVCTAGSLASISLSDATGHASLDHDMVMAMYTGMYLGLVAGLFAILFLLTRFHYLSQVEKDALQRDETSNSEPSGTET